MPFVFRLFFLAVGTGLSVVAVGLLPSYGGVVLPYWASWTTNYVPTELAPFAYIAFWVLAYLAVVFICIAMLDTYGPLVGLLGICVFLMLVWFGAIVLPPQFVFMMPAVPLATLIAFILLVIVAIKT